MLPMYDFRVVRYWGLMIKFVMQLNIYKVVQTLNINDIRKLYPDEWVLIGNPEMDKSKIDVLSGIPIFHSKDKKEVCYIGRSKTSAFDRITLIFTGAFKPTRKITGIFNRKK